MSKVGNFEKIESSYKRLFLIGEIRKVRFFNCLFSEPPGDLNLCFHSPRQSSREVTIVFIITPRDDTWLSDNRLTSVVIVSR